LASKGPAVSALALLEHYYIRNLGYTAGEATWKGTK